MLDWSMASSLPSLHMIEQFWPIWDGCVKVAVVQTLPPFCQTRPMTGGQPSDRKPAREVTGKLTAGQFGQFGQYTNPMPFIPFPNNWQQNNIISKYCHPFLRFLSCALQTCEGEMIYLYQFHVQYKNSIYAIWKHILLYT